MTKPDNKKPSNELVFLIGFMGSGKTTWGKKLAAATGRVFIDLDQLISEVAGMSIPEYFKLYGEEQFRILEREVLQTLTTDKPAIISTGGGAPCYFDNMEWMNQQGVTIYLQLTPKALLSRLNKQKSIDARPALKGLRDDALLAFIEEKLGDRESFYKQAQFSVDQLTLSMEKLYGILAMPPSA